MGLAAATGSAGPRPAGAGCRAPCRRRRHRARPAASSPVRRTRTTQHRSPDRATGARAASPSSQSDRNPDWGPSTQVATLLAPAPFGVIPGSDLGLTPEDDATLPASHYRLPMAGPERSHAGTQESITVLIADDQALVRAGFRSILEGQPGITVVGEAGDGRDAVDLARRRRPDMVLMDIQMPDLDGLEATRRIVDSVDADHPIAVLMLTTFDLNEY